MSLSKKKGQYKTRIMEVYHPLDESLPVKERRLLFSYQIEIKNINFDLVDKVNPTTIEYKLKEIKSV